MTSYAFHGDPTEPIDYRPRRPFALGLRLLVADCCALPLIAAGVLLGGAFVAAGAVCWRAVAPKGQ